MIMNITDGPDGGQQETDPKKYLCDNVHEQPPRLMTILSQHQNII